MSKETRALTVVGGVLGYSPATPAKSAPRNMVRRFKAAKGGRLAGGFGSILSSSPRSEVRQDIRGLIGHARFAAQNVDHLKSYEMMVRRHVVGWNGVALSPNVLNADGSSDVFANDALKRAWAKWGKRKNCTPSGRLSWWQIEKMAATMLAREGNFFLREWRGRAFGPFGYQVQPISIDLLDVDMVQTLSGGNYVDGGIEFSALGRPLAFHFFDGHPQEAHTGRHRKRIRIPADQLIHVQRISETGQALGVPESHTALRRFNMLHGYEESALAAAHYGASAMVFLEQEGDGAPVSAAAADDNELPEEMEAGMIVDLPPGYKVKGNPSNYPDANMPGFMKSMMRGGAAGLGVSYAGLSSDMEGANFSSLKDGRGEERDEWRLFQRDLWEELHDPVFEGFLPMALLMGQIKGPAGQPFPASRLEKLADAAKWSPRAWDSVNPKDDATANASNLENRLTTPSDIVARRGDNWDDLVSRFKRDMDALKTAGVPLSSALAGLPKNNPPATPKPADGEDSDT